MMDFKGRAIAAGALAGWGIVLLGATQAYGATSAVSASPATDVVTVTGSGNATGTPDELQLSLEVDTQAASVSAALAAANQDMTQVRDALRAHGVAQADLQTSGLSAQPSYGQQGNVTGYQVTESLAATLHDLSQAGATIGAAADAGGNAVRIDGVSLDVSDRGALLATARANAIADAKAKASQYASAAGRTLGPVSSISEVSDDYGPIPLPTAMFGVASARSASAVPIAAGSQRVGVSVTVTYALS
jgi:uncharacterized protein YggE